MTGRLRRLAAHLVAALAALLTVAGLPAPAAAAPQPVVSGGRLDWGIKQSFLTYVTGPIAKGGWSLTGGAATVGGSTFRFHSATGGYDPATGALTASFQGGVRFTGHRENGTDALDLAIGRLTLTTTGAGRATLSADVTSRSRETGKVTATPQTPLADLSLAGTDLRAASGTLTLTNVPATLTDAGAQAFGHFYTAGTALDPLTLSVTLKAAEAEPTRTPAPDRTPSGGPATPGPDPTANPTGDPTATPAPGPTTGGPAAFADGALDWGIRRTFRDYVTGAVAKGRWQLADGAADGGAYFRWTTGKGGYDPATGALDAAFTGSVRFTGHTTGDTHGLDLTLAAPRITIADGQGRLTADVHGHLPGAAAQQQTAVELARFDPAGAVKTEGGLLRAVELPLRLTESGARVFGSLYPVGTEMDPLSFALALDPAAALPPLPDLGSAPAATPAPQAAPAAASSRGVPVAAAVAGALLLAALALGGGLLAVRRRRRPGPSDPS
ncbi:HtaA domain-containing protein [Kitasatospora camelliae]|uniref:HtaA domain-containing protein n=1 Tax=Kitasatospora camelliae TaxID=3156397 RepID=UPI003B586998